MARRKNLSKALESMFTYLWQIHTDANNMEMVTSVKAARKLLDSMDTHVAWCRQTLDENTKEPK